MADETPEQGTPQDGTVRHQVVDSEGNEVVPAHVGTQSLHELAEVEPEKQDEDDEPEAEPKPRRARKS